jgi:hypothetical protein
MAPTQSKQRIPAIESSSREDISNSQKMSIWNLRASLISVIQSRKAEQLCPLPGRLDQMRETIELLESGCQFLQRVLEDFHICRRQTIDKEVLLMADYIIQRISPDFVYMVRGIANAISKELEVSICTLFGPVDLMTDFEKCKLSKVLGRLLTCFDSLVQAVLNREDQRLTETLLSFHKIYMHVRKLYLPKV